MQNYAYQIYGLNLLSDIPLPGLTIEPGLTCDLSIQIAVVPEKLVNCIARGYTFYIAPGKFLLTIANVGRFLITAQKIMVESAPGAKIADVALFILSAALPVVLQLRGLLVLQGAAFLHNGRGVMVCGVTGSGKSALMAALWQAEYTIITEGFGVVDCNSAGLPLILPGYPYLKLWQDTLTMIGLASAQLTRWRDTVERYMLPLGDKFCSRPMVLDTIYFHNNQSCDHTGLCEVAPENCKRMLDDYSYRYNFFVTDAMTNRHRALCKRVTDSVSLRMITKSQRQLPLPELVKLLEGDLRQ